MSTHFSLFFKLNKTRHLVFVIQTKLTAIFNSQENILESLKKLKDEKKEVTKRQQSRLKDFAKTCG